MRTQTEHSLPHFTEYFCSRFFRALRNLHMDIWVSVFSEFPWQDTASSTAYPRRIWRSQKFGVYCNNCMVSIKDPMWSSVFDRSKDLFQRKINFLKLRTSSLHAHPLLKRKTVESLCVWKLVLFGLTARRPCVRSLKSQAKKGSNTKDSQTVTHSSTNLARRCLTSVFGREPVFSTWYGR